MSQTSSDASLTILSIKADLVQRETRRRVTGLALAALLTACGGGGGGDGSPVVSGPTTIDGLVSPLVSPGAVTALAYPFVAGATSRADMLIPTNTAAQSYATIQQHVYYELDLAAGPIINVATMSVSTVDPASPLALATGGLAYAGDATLGQLSATYTSGPDDSRVSLVVTLESVATMGTLLVGAYCQSNCLSYLFGLVLPYSAAINPDGYSFLTFGAWAMPAGPIPPPGALVENWFSAGIPTNPASIPAAGTANYTGQADGSAVTASTRDLSDVGAIVHLTVDFAARSVSLAFSTSTSLSFNAAPGVLPTVDNGLNLNGTLTYVAGSNTFSGAVTNPSGMAGNATCRFYGPAIGAASPTKVVGSPPEIGCTFALLGSGIGAMYGSLGSK